MCSPPIPAVRHLPTAALRRIPNPSNPTPSAAQQPKGGGRLVSTHAALSPELGSRLKARSGCKSGTTAPGVQGAGRGPLATSLVTFLFAQESNPPVGAGPDNPSGRMPENLRRGNPSKTTGGSRKTPKEKTFQLPAHRRPPGNTKLGPPLAPAGPPPHRGGRFPLR